MPDPLPLFTIGIPTFNRVELLKQSLNAARSQIYENVEIIISDNASTDGTQEYCESIDDARVRYYRNSTNRGPEYNFRRCLELATGEYFSWLQDDDAIFPDYASRAVQTLTMMEADAYLATAIASRSIEFICGNSLYGPPISLSWLTGECTEVEPDLMIPLSTWCTVAIPPVVAFRTAFLRDIMADANAPDCGIFWERLLLVAAALKGRVLAAPHIAGVFRMHDSQACVQLSSLPGEFSRQWNLFAQLLERLVATHKINPDHFTQYVSALPDRVLKDFSVKSLTLPFTGAIGELSRDILAKEVNLRSDSSRKDLGPVQQLVGVVRGILRQVTPPFIRTIALGCERWTKDKLRSSNRGKH
jgi:glycosyltransferase involved in cell wall biosynthesis